MNSENDRIFEQAEAFIGTNWGLTKVKELKRHPFSLSFAAVDGSGMKHYVQVNVKSPENAECIIPRNNVFIEREAVLQKTLNHENIVKVYNSVSLPDCVVLDMEYCDISLTDFLEQHGGVVPESLFRVLARQMTAAVHYLHSQGIAHRDIKPSHVFLCERGSKRFVVKISGFLFSKKEQDGLTLCLGSPLYMAPEVVSRIKYTTKCDIWSLGVMYYQMLTGAFPSDIYHRLQSELATDEQLVAFALPDSLAVSECCKDFVRSHLFKDPNLRFSAEQAMNHPFLLNFLLEVKSSFRCCVDDFNNEETYPDLDFVIQGLDKPLHLHRGVLGRTSSLLDALFRAKASVFGAYDEDAHRLEWGFGNTAANTEYRDVLVKWLRFCYGEDQSFMIDECPSALVVLLQLQLKCENEVKEQIVECMIEAAASDVECGVKILQECVIACSDYDYDGTMKNVRERLAKTVLTRHNLENHFGIVSDCLMKLPACYLDAVEYGEDCSEKGELCVRMRYVKFHQSIPVEAKREILMKCEETKISSEELKQLEELNIFRRDEIMEIRVRTNEIKLEEERKLNQEIIKEIRDMKQAIAEKSRVIDFVYPIGSVYLSVVDIDPATLFGGTWERWGLGRVPVGVDPARNEFSSPEKTGGHLSHDHTLSSAAAMIGVTHHQRQRDSVSHVSHCATDVGDHGTTTILTDASYGIFGAREGEDRKLRTHNTALTGTTDNSSNLQPFITCFMWKRTQ